VHNPLIRRYHRGAFLLSALLAANDQAFARRLDDGKTEL
jgi:hypothetical protein